MQIINNNILPLNTFSYVIGTFVACYYNGDLLLFYQKGRNIGIKEGLSKIFIGG
jgi:hypothetical protein